ncbi:hypothetical protein [Gloeocapsopsis dulcis]|uniref:hypothetical protein n=1 Tax=Gloeocapsopsis dulcis TaxID=2859516 RepID=UPI0018C5B6BA|nr:hypothetical protein [Gloeocapsopsis dulcis]WNN87750.1 hypothetical protein P0S91_15665 [Gloeocapsopsis dulcis]
MLHSEDLSFHGTLSVTLFEQLKQLLYQMAQVVETEAVVLTQEILLSIPVFWGKQQFTIIISQGFSALLLGTPLAQEKEESEPSNIQNSVKMPDADDAAYISSIPAEFLSFGARESLIDVNLTFDRDVIAHFLRQLSHTLQHDFQAYQTLAQ